MLPMGNLEITYYQDFSPGWLPKNTRTPDGKYNLLANHLRYGPQVKLSMYPDTKLVTIMREPAALFESLYIFFRLSLANGGLSFENFLRTPVKPDVLVSTNPKVYYGYNQMSMDLGLDPSNFKNETAIREFIHYIDEEFDLVMITERMDESLVLLANMMEWSLDYVSYLKSNSRPSEKKYQTTDFDRVQLLELNYADSLLYAHFVEKFQRCVVQYGVDRMNKDVDRLRELNRKLEQRCVDNTKVKNGVVVYQSANKTDLLCHYAIMDQVSFTNELKTIQAKKLNAIV